MPSSARAAFDKGQAFFKQERWDEAIAAYRAAAKKDPDQLFEAGKWGKENGLEKEAEKIFKRVLKFDKDHAGANQALRHLLSGPTQVFSCQRRHGDPTLGVHQPAVREIAEDLETRRATAQLFAAGRERLHHPVDQVRAHGVTDVHEDVHDVFEFEPRTGRVGGDVARAFGRCLAGQPRREPGSTDKIRKNSKIGVLPQRRERIHNHDFVDHRRDEILVLGLRICAAARLDRVSAAGCQRAGPDHQQKRASHDGFICTKSRAKCVRCAPPST